MQITIYQNFKKRHNSTKRPTGGMAVNVRLKESTSIEQPTFILTIPQDIDFTTYNYCYFVGHYYFVSDIRYITNNIYEMDCTQDVLATYKDDILSYQGFVERSATQRNQYIHDPYRSQLETKEYKVKDTTVTGFNVEGCYLVRCSGFSGLRTYVATEDQLQSLFAFMYNTSGSLWESITDQIATVVFNPFEYILGVWWYPISYLNMVSSSHYDVYLGKYNTGVNLYTAKVNINFTGTILKPSATYSDSRDYDPSWTSGNIYLPGVGMIGLNVALLQDTMSYRIDIDTNTGLCEWKITNLDATAISDAAVIQGVYRGKLGSEVQISQLSNNIHGEMSGLTNMGIGLASLASGNVGGLASVTGGVMQTITSISQPSQAINGAAGERGIIVTNTTIKISIERKNAAPIDAGEIGQALYYIANLSGLSGYVKMQNASIDIAGYAGDKDAVNSYLNSGFYIE